MGFNLVFLYSMTFRFVCTSALTSGVVNSEVMTFGNFAPIEKPRLLFGNSCGLRIPAELRRKKFNQRHDVDVSASVRLLMPAGVASRQRCVAARLRQHLSQLTSRRVPPLWLIPGAADNRRRKPSRAAHCCTSL